MFRFQAVEFLVRRHLGSDGIDRAAVEKWWGSPVALASEHPLRNRPLSREGGAAAAGAEYYNLERIGRLGRLRHLQPLHGFVE
jgi:hypothetical protein